MSIRSFLTLVLVLLLAAAIGAGIWFGGFVFTPISPREPAVVILPPGLSSGEIARRLESAGVIADADRFLLLARLSGRTRRIKAGEYDFQGPATPEAVLARLVSGDVRRHRLVIPEGYTVAQIAATLEAAGLAPAAEIRRLATDKTFLTDLGLDAPSLEGYLFPETYTFTAGSSPAELLRAMVRQFRLRLTAEMTDAAAEKGLSPHQLVTLASIIQKEAGSNAEMPMIASVFHNRLRRGIPLQADPTVIYGIADFDGNLTRRHLETPTPYNTYRHRGLPPGPIANPGEDALRAAAWPVESVYLYFVARGDGTHYFSANLREHNQAVQRYQLHRGSR